MSFWRLQTQLVNRCAFPWFVMHSRLLCSAGLMTAAVRALKLGPRRSVWVFGQEPGQTGAESDGVITLHAALLSALA